MEKNSYYICKKNVSVNNKLLFEVGKKYKHNGDKYLNNQTFIYYDEFAIDFSKKGYTFYDKIEIDHQYSFLLSDYFYTLREERKIKLEKLENVR